MLRILLASSLLLFTIVPVAAAQDAALLATAKAWAGQDEEMEVDFLAGAKLVDRLEKEPGPEAALWRFRVLCRALMGLDFEKSQKPQIAAWLKKHDNEVVYSEPSGIFLVVQDRIWELYEKSKSSPLAEEIAWEAAGTFLPGECEGYLACYAEADLRGVGRFIEDFPKSSRAREAVEGIYWLNETPSPEEFPLDPADIATCKKLFDHWRKILAAVPGTEKQRAGLEAVVKAYKIR